MKVRDVLKHVSFSTLTKLVDRPDRFLREKCFGIKDLPTLAMVVGTALHAGAQAAVEDASVDMEKVALTKLEDELQSLGGIDAIVEEDGAEKYEKAIKEVGKACKNFLAALPSLPLVPVTAEAKVETDVSEYGIPSLGYLDLDCGDVIVDWKFVKTLTKEGVVKPRYDQQAWFYRDLKAAQGIKIDKALFVEVKRAESKNGAPNFFVYEVAFDETSPSYATYRMFVEEAKLLLDADVRLLAGKTSGTRSFLANDAQQAQEALMEEKALLEKFLASGSAPAAADAKEVEDDGYDF
jgi:hypothetical protein